MVEGEARVCLRRDTVERGLAECLVKDATTSVCVRRQTVQRVVEDLVEDAILAPANAVVGLQAATDGCFVVRFNALCRSTLYTKVKV
jgi:hypothetical protein